MFARERACDCDLCVAFVAAFPRSAIEERKGFARIEEFITTEITDPAVNATSTKASLVGGVDDGVARKVDHAVVRNVERGV